MVAVAIASESCSHPSLLLAADRSRHFHGPAHALNNVPSARRSSNNSHRRNQRAVTRISAATRTDKRHMSLNPSVPFRLSDILPARLWQEKVNRHTPDSQMVPHSGTNEAAERLDSQIGRDGSLSFTYGGGWKFSALGHIHMCASKLAQSRRELLSAGAADGAGSPILLSVPGISDRMARYDSNQTVV